MERILRDEIDFHAHSFLDSLGRVFWWNGQLYRGIGPEGAPLIEELFENGLIQELVNRGFLIETELTPLSIEGYDMVVRHRIIPFLSYPHEWCPAMFKTGALATIDLAIELARHGVTLKDAHPHNVVFDACKPVWVDLLSIQRTNDDLMWPSYDHFCEFWLRPLILMSHGQDQLARLLLWAGTGISMPDFLKLQWGWKLGHLMPSTRTHLKSILRRHLPERYRSLIHRGLKAIRSSPYNTKPISLESRLNFLRNLRNQLANIPLPATQRPSNALPQATQLRPREPNNVAIEQTLGEILAKLRPASILDVNSGTGQYSKLAAQLGSDVVSFDSDSFSITDLYNDASKNHLRILPLVMDFVRPTPSCGPSSHWSLAASDRFQCEMVLAIGLLHYVVRDLRFQHIVEGLAAFTKRWLVVEFIPREDERLIGKWWSNRIPWYSLDNLITALGQRFRTVNTIQSYRGSTVLLLCEK